MYGLDDGNSKSLASSTEGPVPSGLIVFVRRALAKFERNGSRRGCEYDSERWLIFDDQAAICLSVRGGMWNTRQDCTTGCMKR